MTAPLIRVLVVDDQELVRSGLSRILRPRDGIEVVAECTDGDEVVAAVAAHTVDVVVMDLRMKRVDGVVATRLLRSDPAAPPVLALTTFDDDVMLGDALQAGAAGFLLKDTPADELIRAVRVIAAGGAFLDPAVTARVMAGYGKVRRGDAAAVLGELTPREADVLAAMGRGRTNGEIAEELVISELTVKSHVGRIFSKLELRDRPAAIVLAHRVGLVRP